MCYLARTEQVLPHVQNSNQMERVPGTLFMAINGRRLGLRVNRKKPTMHSIFHQVTTTLTWAGTTFIMFRDAGAFNGTTKAWTLLTSTFMII